MNDPEYFPVDTADTPNSITPHGFAMLSGDSLRVLRVLNSTQRPFHITIDSHVRTLSHNFNR
jgi:hypothetical protein